MEETKQRIKEILDQEPLKKRGYKFVGIGADKVVLETPGSTRKIIKVSQTVLRQKISNLLSAENYSPDDFENKNHEAQREQIDELERDEKEIKDIFGEEHFLKTGVFKIKIPITKEFLLSFLGNERANAVEKLPDYFETEIEMLAETQVVAEELRDPEKFSTIEFSTDLITHTDFFKQINIDEALRETRSIIDDNFLVSFEELLKDEKYKIVVREIVSKIIEYTKRTGLMIDIFGQNNITIYKKEDGSIDYHIIEALLPRPKELWDMNMSQDPTLKRLRHYYVYYYSMKSIADMIGIEDSIKPEDLVYFKNSAIPTGEWPPESTIYR